MKVAYIFLAALLLSTARGIQEPNGKEICRLFADNVQLRSPGTCEEYVTCKNGKSQYTTCDGKLYDKESKKCASKTSDKYCDDPCGSKSPTWVADPKSCIGYFKCVEGVGAQRSCPSDMHFEQSSQSCVYIQDSSCTGYAYCDVVPNNVPFKDESSCNKYFMCVKSELKEFLCDSGYYHPQRGCISKAEVECDVHPFPINVCGTVKRPIYDKFVIDERTCRGYLYCADKGENTPDLNPWWGQCPQGYFFTFEEQSCFTSADVQCDYDRCEGLNRAKVISGRQGCQHYLLCNGDVTVGESQCENGMYFDDKNMVCTSLQQNYGACS